MFSLAVPKTKIFTNESCFNQRIQLINLILLYLKVIFFYAREISSYKKWRYKIQSKSFFQLKWIDLILAHLKAQEFIQCGLLIISQRDTCSICSVSSSLQMSLIILVSFLLAVPKAKIFKYQSCFIQNTKLINLILGYWEVQKFREY